MAWSFPPNLLSLLSTAGRSPLPPIYTPLHYATLDLSCTKNEMAGPHDDWGLSLTQKSFVCRTGNSGSMLGLWPESSGSVNLPRNNKLHKQHEKEQVVFLSHIQLIHTDVWILGSVRGIYQRQWTTGIKSRKTQHQLTVTKPKRNRAVVPGNIVLGNIPPILFKLKE